jgi:alkanesulfonate monooxygenase SsuD/methylene tetrahydromethanopterin reductase-like flavin-dependent oxidoreductase (luciferase family)
LTGSADRETPEPERAPLPIGVSLATIGAEIDWWLESARRLEAAGYADLWAWDHFVSRGDRRTPVLEQWVTLAVAAGTTRRIGLGTFVANVMNRHPAVVARMAATLQAASGGRLTLGIGVGGHPDEHAAYGIPFPPVGQRAARLESAVAVIRALWTGGPVTLDDPFHPLCDAYAHPIPAPRPRIVVGGETTAGARLAARIGDGWTAFDRTFERDLAAYLEALDEAGRRRADQRLVVAFEAGRAGRDALAGSPWIADPGATRDRWRAAGADAAIVTARTTADVDALVEAAGRW